MRTFTLLPACFCGAMLLGCQQQPNAKPTAGESHVPKSEKAMTDREKLIAKIEAQDSPGEQREIRAKREVQDVLVRIYDYDDPTSWPYTDTVYIISSAPLAKIEQWVSPLLPDEVHAEWMYGTPPAAPEVRAGMTPYSVWWD
jgi:hypothetical protein